MHITDITNEIHAASQRLSKSADALFELGREKAETEREYRSELAKEMLRLKSEGMQVTLITDIAKGNVSERLFQRDLAEARFKAGIEAADAIKIQVSALQTILKYQSDI